MSLNNDQHIADILRDTRSIALLGASRKPERPSHRVMKFLMSQGYEVYPVNPGLAGDQILGRDVHASLAAIPHPVDMVDVFRNARYLPSIVDETIAQGIGTLWTQLDVVDEAAVQRARDSGITVVQDRCPVIEWERLSRLGLLTPNNR